MGFLEDYAMTAGPTAEQILKGAMGSGPFNPRIDPNAVGNMSEFERAQYLEYLKKAQEAGLKIGRAHV